MNRYSCVYVTKFYCSHWEPIIFVQHVMVCCRLMCLIMTKVYPVIVTLTLRILPPAQICLHHCASEPVICRAKVSQRIAIVNVTCKRPILLPVDDFLQRKWNWSPIQFMSVLHVCQWKSNIFQTNMRLSTNIKVDFEPRSI